MLIYDVNLKKINYSLKEKCFLKKVGLNIILSESNVMIKKSLFRSNHLYLKNCLYTFLKLIKVYKSFNYSEDSYNDINEMCVWLQRSNVYYSFVELEKQEKFLVVLLKHFLWSVREFEIKNSPLLKDLHSNKATYSGKIGFKVFDEKVKYLNPSRSKFLLSFLKSRKFFEGLFSNQFVLNLRSYKKMYLWAPGSLKSASIKIKMLSSIYLSSFLRYISVKGKNVKIYKKLVWKRKSLHKWRQSVLFRFFRSRHRLFFKFYVPRYLEINYKTFNFILIDNLDVSSLNSKITFWLNIRRLLTFISS